MTTSTSLVYLIALPLAGAALLLLGGRRTDKWGHLLATALAASSFGVGVYQLIQMLGRSEEARPVSQKLFDWINVGTFNVDGFTRLDLGSRYEFNLFGKNMTARLNVRNVTNIRFIEGLAFGSFLYGAPTTAIFSIPAFTLPE